MSDPETSSSESTRRYLRQVGQIISAESGELDQEILEIAARDHERSEADEAALREARERHPDTFYSDLIYTLANIRYSQGEARTTWVKLLQHKWEMSERVGRNIGIRVAALDYFMNVLKLIGKAKIIESTEFIETTVLAITDGRTILTLPPAQDHRRAYDGDTGPNTGGMGAYSPAPLVDADTLHVIEEQVLVPTVHAMKRGRRPFRGVLYAGLMMTNQGPKVLEFNVRFGDPECQPILMRLQSDLLDVLEATIDGRLDELEPLRFDPRPAVCVVMASEGYPGSYEREFPIRGLEEAAKIPDVKVFHAGTATLDGQVVTNGGRVLAVTALGSSIPAAKLLAYTAVKCIRWKGAWCRKDISDRALDSVR